MSKLNVLVIDSCGIYAEIAVRFMRDCASVKYCASAGEELSSKIGVGLDGIERVDSPWAYLDDVDFIFCPDTDSGDMVEFLRKHGYPVAGAGSVEKLETDRWYARNMQKKNGLPVQETVMAKGITALKDVCRNPEKYFENGTKEFFVKVDNGYRGLSESFKHVDFKTSEPRIDFIAYKTGPFKETVEFICEEKLEGVEPGFDGITFDGAILYPTMAGYEIGKKSHLVRVYKDEASLPWVYKQMHEGMRPEFEKRKTRFFYSDEMIICKDKAAYLLDPTMRFASPGFTTQCELIENFTEVCYGLAIGEPVNPIIKHKYGMTSILFTTEAEKNYVNINFPKELRQWVKLIQGCKVGNDYYSVPPEHFVCSVVALGDTIKETVDLCKSRIDEVKFEGKVQDDSGLKKMMDLINEGREVGIDF
jgi:phosphoribosylamine-glycine ligase